jgi:hypothetical protein
MWGRNSRVDLGTLKYPKHIFSIREVKREKKKLDYPNAWVFKQTKEDYLLKLNPKRMARYVK